MYKKIITSNQIPIAVINSKEPVITDIQSALELMSAIQYYDNSHRIAIKKEAIIETFFDLRTGIAGEILQKFINYRKKIAIIGDFSSYDSKALKDFIGESNRGNDVFFVADEQTAIKKLSAAI